jgi:hypothetical protein
MSKKIKLPVLLSPLFLVILLLVASCSQKEVGQAVDDITFAADNPIDAYFIARIESAFPEIERRELQDTYRGVWQAEYENVLAWLAQKCEYQDDKDKLALYAANVEEMIAAARDVMLIDWLDTYQVPPNDPDRNSWGMGTRSGLNQVTGEIYRNAAMLLIENCAGYKFRNIDYSQEYYE